MANIPAIGVRLVAGHWAKCSPARGMLIQTSITNISQLSMTYFYENFFTAAPAKQISRHPRDERREWKSITAFMLFLHDGCLTAALPLSRVCKKSFFAISSYVERTVIRKLFSMVKS